MIVPSFQYGHKKAQAPSHILSQAHYSPNIPMD